MAIRRTSELAKAMDKLEQLLVEQDALATRIAKQKRVIAVRKELSKLEEETGPPVGLVSGITDACRTVLRSAEKPLLPTEVRDRVEHYGIPEQRNLLASVHTVIRRLKEAGEVRHVQPQISSGPMKYEWAGPKRRGF